MNLILFVQPVFFSPNMSSIYFLIVNAYMKPIEIKLSNFEHISLLYAETKYVLKKLNINLENPGLKSDKELHSNIWKLQTSFEIEKNK